MRLLQSAESEKLALGSELGLDGSEDGSAAGAGRPEGDVEDAVSEGLDAEESRKLAIRKRNIKRTEKILADEKKKIEREIKQSKKGL